MCMVNDQYFTAPQPYFRFSMEGVEGDGDRGSSCRGALVGESRNLISETATVIDP